MRPSRNRKILGPLGHLWALPLTCAGLVLAIASGARFAGVREGAIDILAPRRGPMAAFFRLARVHAFTWGETIVYRDALCLADRRLRRHERAHVRQARAWGPLLALAYPASSIWQVLRGQHAYRDNAFEVAARAAETSAPTGPEGAGRPGASSRRRPGSSA